MPPALFLVATVAMACNAPSVQVFPRPVGIACELAWSGNAGTCVRSNAAVRILFGAENESVANLLFSLSSSSTEASVQEALAEFPSSDSPVSQRYAVLLRIRTWNVPVRSQPVGVDSPVQIGFVDGKVGFARWAPTKALQFDFQYAELVDPCEHGWRPPNVELSPDLHSSK